MRPPELERDLDAVTPMLRAAIDADRLRRVLLLAGADEVGPSAPGALREVAAEALARRMGARTPGRRVPPGLDSNALEEARGATRRAYIELAAHQAGSARSTEGLQQELAVEIAALAHQAVAFARSEGRAVDAACIAVAASRLGSRKLTV